MKLSFMNSFSTGELFEKGLVYDIMLKKFTNQSIFKYAYMS